MRIGTKGALWLLIALLLLFAALPVLADGEESVKPDPAPILRCLPAEGEAAWAAALQEQGEEHYLSPPPRTCAPCGWSLPGSAPCCGPGRRSCPWSTGKRRT